MIKYQHFKNCLKRVTFFSIFNPNYKVLATKIYKVIKELSLKLLENTLMLRIQPNYNLWHITCFKMPLFNSVYKGTEDIDFLGFKVCELVSEEVK